MREEKNDAFSNGYSLIRPQSRALRVKDVRTGLGESMFGRNIVWSERMDSTHTEARALAAGGAPEGTLVIAEEQTAGRGRMGRRWMSPAHANLLFSMILRPPLKAERVFILTMTLAVAAIDGIEAVCDVAPAIKWPNDLYVTGRKLGGILTEFSVTEKDVDVVVLGLGLNVNWNPLQAEGLPYPATSLLFESGKTVSREDLLVGILLAYESRYRQVLEGDGDSVYHRWNRRSMLFGRPVRVSCDGPPVEGEAVRIERDGSLIVRDAGGVEHRIVYGDVSVREIAPPGSSV